MTKIIHLIAAARPNFMKIAPLFHALKREPWCDPAIVHTGQHYDANMSDAFFRDLQLPEPHRHLGIGSGTHAEQTGGVMMAYERLCQAERPDLTVVVGDVNSTMACTLAATKLLIPVAHLEAGLRSGDRTMPEEINRVVTDALCEILWTPSEDADRNLAREGVAAGRVSRVGNIMIDSYEMMRPAIERAETRNKLGLKPGGYAVVTLHRPANVDDATALEILSEAMIAIAAQLPLVFPAHPRTRKALTRFGLLERVANAPGVHLVEPMGYIAFMSLMREAKAAITDSGGIQEETTYLGIPCLTLRPNTERPITVSRGTNRLVTATELGPAVGRILAGAWAKGERPELWDGATAGRVVADLVRRLKPARNQPMRGSSQS